MSLGVLNNLSAVYAENNLSNSQNHLSKTLQQLSSGSKINSGADDAAGLSLVNGLQANQQALTQSKTNTQEGVGLLQVADGALSQVNSLLKTMADNGAIFANMAVYANAFQKQSLTKLFGYAPMDRNVGGVNVETIETDFAKIAIKYAPHVPAGTLLVADLSVIHPVFLPVPDKGYMFYEELSKVGAAESGQVYAQAGLDYGPAAYHGTITGLATS